MVATGGRLTHDGSGHHLAAQRYPTSTIWRPVVSARAVWQPLWHRSRALRLSSGHRGVPDHHDDGGTTSRATIYFVYFFIFFYSIEMFLSFLFFRNTLQNFIKWIYLINNFFKCDPTKNQFSIYTFFKSFFNV